jgi:hypothetical protein
MTRRSRLSLLLPLSLALPALATAAETTYASAGVASRWLKLPRNAWEASLGGGIAGLGAGLPGAEADPAALASLDAMEAGLGYRRGAADSGVSRLALASPGLGGGWLLSYDHLDLGAVETFEVNGGGTLTQGASLRPWEGALGLAYGHRLPAGLKAGVAVQGVMQDLGPQRQLGWNVDASLRAGLPYGLDLGAGLARVSVSGPQLGAEGRGSLAWRVTDSVGLGAELRLALEDSGLSQGIFGAQWQALGALQLRAGYVLGAERAPRGFGAGFGVDLKGFGLDYAFSGVGELGSSQQLSLHYRFPAGAEQRPVAAQAPLAPALVETPVAPPAAPLPATGVAAVQEELQSLLSAVKNHDYEAADQLALKLQTAEAVPLAPEQRQAAVAQLQNVEVRQAVLEGDDGHAVSSLNTLSRLEPDNAYAQLALGVFASREGRHAEALKHFEEAYRLDPSRVYLPRFIQQAREAAALEP